MNLRMWTASIAMMACSWLSYVDRQALAVLSPVILADTGPLYALADPSDQYHKRATRELESIIQAHSVAISIPVLCEAHTLILRRLGGNYARQWLGEILAGGIVLSPGLDDIDSAVERLEKFRDHPLTLTDTVLASVSARMSAPVWTFDRHFSMMSASVWPSQ